MGVLVLGVTGHRPEKLGGYSASAQDTLVDFSVFALHSYQPAKVITGMALGFDTAVAKAALNLGIPFIAAVPFRGQEKKWAWASQEEYWQLLGLAESVVYVCSDGFSVNKMQIRNEWIVDNCTHLMSLYDGSSGGTKNCIDYANKVKKPTVNVWDCYVSFATRRV